MRPYFPATLFQIHPWLSFRLTARAALLVALTLVWPPMQAVASGAVGTPQLFADGFEGGDSLSDAALLPAPDSVLASGSLPVIGVRRARAGSDPTSWRLFLNGEDITGRSEVSANAILFRPSDPIVEAEHVVEVRFGTATRAWSFRVGSGPSVIDVSPDSIIMDRSITPIVAARFRSGLSPIDLSSVRLFVDGVDVTHAAEVTAQAIRYLPPGPQLPGRHNAEVVLSDTQGVERRRSWTYALASQPEVVASSPSQVTLTARARPQIYAHIRDPEGTPLDRSSVQFYVDFEDVRSEVVIEPVSDSEVKLLFVPPGPMTSGNHSVAVGMANVHGGTVSESWYFDVAAEDDRRIVFLHPQDGAVLLGPELEAVLGVEPGLGFPVRVAVNGREASVLDAEDGVIRFRVVVPVESGDSELTALVEFHDGSEKSTSISVRRHVEPSVRINSPADWSSLGPVAGPGAAPTPGGALNLTGAVQRPVAITGTTTTPVVSVQINQQQAQLSADGRSFTFPTYFLHEGANHISAVATDAHGRSASDQITVYVDQTAPLLTVESPTPDTATSLRRIDVRGLVNDAVQAPVETAAPQVLVRNSANGSEIQAVVAGLGYVAEDVLLEVGFPSSTLNRVSN